MIGLDIQVTLDSAYKRGRARVKGRNTMAEKVDQARQDIIDALPVSGRVTYEELRVKLLSAGKTKALARFHDARRDGAVKVQLENGADGQLVMFVSRA